MESSAQRPGLDQPPLFPELFADVCLREPVDTGRELELCRGLDLSVYAAKIANELDEPPGPRAIGQRGTGQSACPNLVPSCRNHRRGSCLPSAPIDQVRGPRKELEPAEMATTVRVEDGKTLTTASSKADRILATR